MVRYGDDVNSPRADNTTRLARIIVEPRYYKGPSLLKLFKPSRSCWLAGSFLVELLSRAGIERVIWVQSN